MVLPAYYISAVNSLTVNNQKYNLLTIDTLIKKAAVDMNEYIMSLNIQNLQILKYKDRKHYQIMYVNWNTVKYSWPADSSIQREQK